MKLATITHISLDGVVQGGGGRDHRGGFERGGWMLPFRSEDGAALVGKRIQRADAFLLGRRTYEAFFPFWGSFPDRTDPIAVSLNSQPKYVASTTLTNPEWTNTTVVSGDLATEIDELKNGSDGELQVHGSLSLVRWLFERRLVDEVTLITYPVIIGQGARLFPDAGPDLALELVESHTTSKGVTIESYRAAGRPQYLEDA